MKSLGGIVLIVGLLIVAVFVIWRLFSRRQSLPCPVWLRWFVELDNPFTKTNRAAVIIEHLGLGPGMTVLDLGCGPGRLAIPLAKGTGPNGTVDAVDIQQGMLDRVKEKADAAKIVNLRLICAGAGEGKLDKNRYDRAVMVTVIGEIPDREAAFKEVFSAMKPGGILSVTELIFDPHFQRRQTVTRLAEAAGFETGPFFGNSIAYTLHLKKPPTE